MRMHDPSLGDDVIEQPEPVTLFLPILEASLRRAGIRPGRDEMIRRFMSGEPRVVIVGGARDHPAQIDDDDVSRRAVAALWNEGALPFETTEPAVCDGIAQGHYGMTFSLASRNITTALLVAHIEAHVYDAALLLDSCDKRPVADLAAVVEIDTYRRRRGKRPFYACFIPAHVMPESHLPPDIADGIRALRGKAGPGYDEEIDALLLHRLKCNTYAMFKKLLDGLDEKGALPAGERDRYLTEIAKMTCEAGGTCAFIGTGNTDKVVLHALGLIEDAPTLEGPWSERLRDALDPDDRILRKTAIRPVSGIVEVKGNFTRSAIFKRAGMSVEAIESFDRRVYVVVFYLGEHEAQQDLLKGRVVDKLRDVLDAGQVRRLARANFGDAASALDGTDDAIVERAARARLLRVMVVIAGEGPKANGIPEMFYPSEYLNRDPVMRHVGALITDGRYSGATYGPCIGHASPEALEGGLIGVLRTGDLVFMDTKARRIDVLDARRSWSADGRFEPVTLDPAALGSRPEQAGRIAWLQERRMNIPSTVRLMLDATTTCMEGVTPVGLAAHEAAAGMKQPAPDAVSRS